MSVFSKEWLENNTLPITDFRQLNITKSLKVLPILVEFLIVKGKP
jgi:hypothetical protein